MKDSQASGIALLSSVVFAWVVVPAASAGGLFKCRTQDGEILYSDIACEKSGAARLGIVEPPPKQDGRGGAAPAEGAPGGMQGEEKEANRALGKKQPPTMAARM